MKIENEFVRQDGEGIEGDQQEYLRRLSIARKGHPLPPEVTPHAVAWPVDMHDPHAHITG